MSARAIEVRERYERFERKAYGREWTVTELALGLVGDVGDLAKLVQAHEGVRLVDGNLAENLGHELSDVLWSTIVLAEKCGIDLEPAFSRTMAAIEANLDLAQ